ncbi:unnamed protein product [Amoebophrya sp. A120]|nr:unnamed protein product [Amoebophrya sp. A120]|eukprot:GSA120T00007653001.1
MPESDNSPPQGGVESSDTTVLAEHGKHLHGEPTVANTNVEVENVADNTSGAQAQHIEDAKRHAREKLAIIMQKPQDYDEDAELQSSSTSSEEEAAPGTAGHHFRHHHHNRPALASYEDRYTVGNGDFLDSSDEDIDAAYDRDYHELLAKARAELSAAEMELAAERTQVDEDGNPVQDPASPFSAAGSPATSPTARSAGAADKSQKLTRAKTMKVQGKEQQGTKKPKLSSYEKVMEKVATLKDLGSPNGGNRKFMNLLRTDGADAPLSAPEAMKIATRVKKQLATEFQANMDLGDGQTMSLQEKIKMQNQIWRLRNEYDLKSN